MKARLLVCSAIVGALLIGTLGGARADDKEKPDAILKISAKAIGVGAGYSWGAGKLTYQGKEYDVDVAGLNVGTVGVTSIDAVGEVYYLKKVEDLNGNYTAATAGGTIGGGAGRALHEEFERGHGGDVGHHQGGEPHPRRLGRDSRSEEIATP